MEVCTGFVVLVGRDGVGRWIGAEAQAALSRHFGPHDDAKRLPIFPLLLGNVAPEVLPAFLRLFQTTSWNGSDPLPETLLQQIRDRTIVVSQAAVFEGCPFVGLDAFRMDQARLFVTRLGPPSVVTRSRTSCSVSLIRALSPRLARLK